MRSEGYNTRLRQAILNFLLVNQDKTVTALEIFNALRQENIKISRTTVYRFLDKLVSEDRLLRYVTDDGKKASYMYVGDNPNHSSHLHLQCTECGKVIHLDCEFMDEIFLHISKHHDFDLKCDSSILYGKCQRCLKKEITE